MTLREENDKLRAELAQLRADKEAIVAQARQWSADAIRLERENKRLREVIERVEVMT